MRVQGSPVPASEGTLCGGWEHKRWALEFRLPGPPWVACPGRRWLLHDRDDGSDSASLTVLLM